MIRPGLLLVTLALGALSCASADAPRVTPRADGCPAILLTRMGGLGFESQSGVIAAVWRSGRIVRAEAAERPWQHHVVGTLADADLGALLAAAEADQAWGQATGQVVLDMPDDTLTLRRGSEVRRWAETPGFTSTPLVEEFRRRLMSVALQGATRLDVSVDEFAACR